MSSANNPPYGAEVAFYCVRPDTAPDLVDIEARAAKGSAMTFFAIYERSSWFSRTVLRLVSPARIVARHRRNYLDLQRALDGAPGCRPLFALLPDDACP